MVGVRSHHNSRDGISRDRQGPLLVQKFLRLQNRAVPGGAVALVQALSQGNSAAAQNLDQPAAECEDNPLASMVMLREVFPGWNGPGSTKLRVFGCLSPAYRSCKAGRGMRLQPG